MIQTRTQDSKILIQNSPNKVQSRDFQIQRREPSLVLESMTGRKFTKHSSQLEDLIHCNYTLRVYIWNTQSAA
jgi:hypothetical protein